MNFARLRFFTFTLLLAASLTHTAPAATATNTASHPLPLWKVEGGTVPVYLLGSVHLLKAENYPLAAPIESAFTNASVVAFETDMDRMRSLDAQMKILSKSRLPEGQTLRDVLPAAVYSNFVSHAKSAGLPPEMFEQLQPVMAAVTIVAMEMRKMGFDPEHGVDSHYFGRAKKAGKEIVPLETVDFQIGLLTDFTKQEAVLITEATFNEFEQQTKEIRELMSAWENGDAQKLESLLNDATRKVPAVFKRLVADRNERWAPQIEKLARGDKQAIVIVGAAHLVGEEGVVNLLKKRGLKVTQQ